MDNIIVLKDQHRALCASWIIYYSTCSWQGCQSVLAKYKCDHKDPQNCSKWQMRLHGCWIIWRQSQSWMTEHSLSRQFMHAFEYFTLRRTWPHQRGFPVRHVIHTFSKLFSSGTCIALIRILVWRCQSKSAIWSYLNLVFFIRDRTSVASHLPIWPMYSSF